MRDLAQQVLRYADALLVPGAGRANNRSGTLRIRYLDDDGLLNALGR